MTDPIPASVRETLSLPRSDAVASPPAGKWVRFVDRPTDPASDPLRFEMWLAPDGHGPMLHVHPEQEEGLAVVSGTLGVRVRDESRTLGPGEEAVVPAGVPHRFWNAGEDALHLSGWVDPGLRTEAFMRVTYGLARDGAPVTPSGAPLNPLRLAALLAAYDDMLWLARVPERLQRRCVGLVAPLARAVGYGDDYPEYLG
ncbi:MAG: cupin domain-containing protein [Haloarculaceae archaeon]